MALTSSLKGNLAGLTGSQYDNAFDPGAGRKLGIWSQVTVDQTDLDVIFKRFYNTKNIK